MALRCLEEMSLHEVRGAEPEPVGRDGTVLDEHQEKPPLESSRDEDGGVPWFCTTFGWSY